MKGSGNGAALLVAAMKPKKAAEDEEMEDAPESEEGDGKAAAGEELAAAIKSGDGARIASAFSDLMEMCGY